MTLAEFRDHCARLPGFSEDLPFDENTLAFRVGGKIFALMDLDLFVSVNLKCDPERAVELRERYPGITPGYHMNKRHWNTVLTDGSVPDKLLLELADHSHALVMGSLPLKVRAALR
jgi:predicted DNA-binding protein (MmcQ/YjbR family)